MVWRPSSEISAERRPAQLQHLEAAGAGTEHAHQMVEHVARHHAGGEPAGQVHPRGLRHGKIDPLPHEGLQELGVDADGEGAEGAELRDVAVEVDDEAAGHRIAGFRRHLVADPLALVQPDPVLRAPGAGDDVQLLLRRRGGRHHMVDEEGEAFRLGDAVDAELLLHLPEDQVEIAGEVVAQHMVGLDLDLRAGAQRDARPARAPENLFRDRVAHRSLPASAASLAPCPMVAPSRRAARGVSGQDSSRRKSSSSVRWKKLKLSSERM